MLDDDPRPTMTDNTSALSDTVGEWLSVELGVCDKEWDSVAVADSETDGVCVDDAEKVPLLVAVPVLEAVDETVIETVLLRVMVVDVVEVLVAVLVAVLVPVDVTDFDGEPVMVTDALALKLIEELADGVSDCDAVAVGDTLSEIDALAVAVFDAVSDIDCVDDRLVLAVMVAVGVLLIEGVLL
jgi:hypothetical protein